MTNMKVPLAAIVFFAILYTIDAACSYQRKCIDSSGKRYQPGRKWTEAYENHCVECYCSKSGAGASCCTTAYIASFPDHCVDIFDDKKCVHHVVEKSDPCKPCSGPIGAVGK